MDFSAANRCRYKPGSPDGHYESWFQRANHPDRPLALWVRYTLFQPPGRPDDAVGEVWAVYFDGERARIHAGKQRFPLSACQLAGESLEIGGNTLTRAALAGSIANAARSASAAGAGNANDLVDQGEASGPLSWSLSVSGAGTPLLLLPQPLYETRLPAAKALVTLPDARFSGSIVAGGERITLQDWRGSLNHNWGRRHTDHYAWGQVAGFDGEPDVVLECATARLRLAGIWTPPMTLVVLRIGNEELRLNGVLRALRNHGELHGFEWHIEAEERGVRIKVHIRATREAFAGLRYDNPGRPVKTCLNSKLASCELRVERPGQPERRYSSAHGAAFEILSDEDRSGVPLLV